MVRALGIEPRTPAWKAGVLPLNYARVQEIQLIRFPRLRQVDLRPFAIRCPSAARTSR